MVLCRTAGRTLIDQLARYLFDDQNRSKKKNQTLWSKAGMHQPYIAIVQIWKTDTENLAIPVLGVFQSAEAAQNNAYVVVARVLAKDAPELLACTVTVTVTAMADDAVREFLTTLHNTRPDLLRTPRRKHS